jgi:ADP-ribose pyrophosphatase
MIPETTKSDLVYDGFLKIRRDRLRLPNGTDYYYESLLTISSAVAVVAITHEGQFILNEEYRHPTNQILLGLPGGYIDAKETPLEAAKRELTEETGYAAETFSLLNEIYPYPGISSQKLFVILAEGAKVLKKPELEPAESIHSILKYPDELKAMILAGYPLDGILCSALFLYDLRSRN